VAADTSGNVYVAENHHNKPGKIVKLAAG